MKMLINLVLILALGVVMGLSIRSYRASTQVAGGPGPDDEIFTDALPLDFDATVNDEPSHPPEDEEWLSRFSLTERSGSVFASEELLGQPYIVSFFFSTCPSTCISQNKKIQELQEEFEGQGVRFVAISVDPETDTPEILREYAARFSADEDQWLFMTGDMTYIRRIGAEVYRLPVNQKFHTDQFVLVDAEGKIEGHYHWPEERQFEKLKETIAKMIEG